MNVSPWNKNNSTCEFEPLKVQIINNKFVYSNGSIDIEFIAKKIHQSVISNYDHDYKFYYTPLIKVVIEQGFQKIKGCDFFNDSCWCRLLKIIDKETFDYSLEEVVKEINKVKYLLNYETYRLIEYEGKDVLNGICEYNNLRINNNYLYFIGFDNVFDKKLTKIDLSFAEKLSDRNHTKINYNRALGKGLYSGLKITKYSNDMFEFNLLGDRRGISKTFKCSNLRSTINLYKRYKTYKSIILSKLYDNLVEKISKDVTNLIMLYTIGYKYKPFDFNITK